MGSEESDRVSEADQKVRLPFEPTKKRQKPTKTKSNPAAKDTKQSEPVTKKTKLKPTAKETKQSQQVKQFTKEEMAIPKVVSDRMARRAAVFCGTPTFLGMATFFLSYFIVTQGWLKLPNVVVVLTSMGFFGLGVLGLTYGILSASWDEDRAGGALGWQEFKVNWGRMVETWRSTRQKNV